MLFTAFEIQKLSRMYSLQRNITKLWLSKQNVKLPKGKFHSFELTKHVRCQKTMFQNVSFTLFPAGKHLRSSCFIVSFENIEQNIQHTSAVFQHKTLSRYLRAWFLRVKGAENELVIQHLSVERYAYESFAKSRQIHPIENVLL